MQSSDTTSKQDNTTSKQNDAKSKQDDATSKQDDATSKQNDATSKQEDTTSKQDDARNKDEGNVAALPAANSVDQQVTMEQPIVNAQVTDATTNTSQQKDMTAVNEAAAGHLSDDKRLSSEATTPPVMSPQSVTSQEGNATFEERAL